MLLLSRNWINCDCSAQILTDIRSDVYRGPKVFFSADSRFLQSVSRFLSRSPAFSFREGENWFVLVPLFAQLSIIYIFKFLIHWLLPISDVRNIPSGEYSSPARRNPISRTVLTYRSSQLAKHGTVRFYLSRLLSCLGHHLLFRIHTLDWTARYWIFSAESFCGVGLERLFCRTGGHGTSLSVLSDVLSDPRHSKTRFPFPSSSSEWETYSTQNATWKFAGRRSAPKRYCQRSMLHRDLIPLIPHSMVKDSGFESGMTHTKPL